MADAKDLNNIWLFRCRLCARKGNINNKLCRYVDRVIITAVDQHFHTQLNTNDKLCALCLHFIEKILEFDKQVKKVQGIYEIWQKEKTEIKTTKKTATTENDNETQENSCNYEESASIASADLIEECGSNDEDDADAATPKPHTTNTSTDANADADVNMMTVPKAGAECGVCHKMLSSKKSLKLHIEGMHLNLKPYICDCCGKALKNKSALLQHMYVHTQDRPAKCPVCNVGFKNTQHLNYHRQTHGDPSYECDICGKKLQTRRTLLAHKRAHTNDYRYKCEACNVGFHKSTALKGHLLSHLRLLPYECRYCGKKFASRVNCDAHSMKKHEEETKLNGPMKAERVKVPTLAELRVLLRENADYLKKVRVRSRRKITEIEEDFDAKETDDDDDEDGDSETS